MSHQIDLTRYGINDAAVPRNVCPARLYEDAIRFDHGEITSTGAVVTRSGEKTGRSPTDKRIVDNLENEEIWWGAVNMPISVDSFRTNRCRAIDYLNFCKQRYVVDGFAGWDPKYQTKIRIICSRAYHALFMHNMLIRPSESELADFGEPDYVIFNAGEFPADPDTPDLTSGASICLNLKAGEFVILGSQYAGEMKKGVFTIMQYLMPKQNVLSMHCSTNEGPDGDVSLFFGLSGTGKTTLSADPGRQLVGDDEHCWTDDGVFNIEGGCYAKCIDLSREKEPEIYDAIRFGTVLENTIHDPVTREVDYADKSITENTRASYPVEFIPNAKIPGLAKHPDNIVFLACDAFGVLPPVSRLTPEQAMYHFISGYTAKVAGTEVGIKEPKVAFSACFGDVFLVWHPTRYAEMLAEKMKAHGSQAWLVNTGWSGGAYGTGSRMNLRYTRAIVDAIHSGDLLKAPTVEDPIFGLSVPTTCPGVPEEILIPKNTWDDPEDYERTARKLAGLFHENFAKYADAASEEIRAAGPKVGVPAGA